MFKVLLITFAGVALGYILRKAGWVRHLSSTITYTIWILLFFFGLQAGSNEMVVSNFNILGLKAFIISVAGTLGSCVMAWGLNKFLDGRKEMVLPVQFCAEQRAVPMGDKEGQQGAAIQEVRESNENERVECNENDERKKIGKEKQRWNEKDVENERVECNENDEWKKIGKEKQRWNENENRKGMLTGMSGGFVVVAFFVVGCLAGWADFVPHWLTDGSLPMYVLYLLMIQVGMSVGSDSRLKEILWSLKPALLLLPLGTVTGTLAFVAVAALFVNGMSLSDCLAVGAGFGYYSLSSVLISQIKEPQTGAALAAQLGTIALMANIMREVITLLLAPLMCRIFGRLAPISAGGATSMDSTLPSITASCGKELAFISIFHGMIVDFSVPFLVTFFASI